MQAFSNCLWHKFSCLPLFAEGEILLRLMSIHLTLFTYSKVMHCSVVSNEGGLQFLCKRKSCINEQRSQRGCKKETFHQNPDFALFYKGFEAHRPVLRIVWNLMKGEKVNIKTTHQGPCACTQSIFGRTAEYFKYPIQQSPYMKEQPLYLC